MKKINNILLFLILITMLSCSESIKESVIVIETVQNISSEKVKVGKNSKYFSPKIMDDHLKFSINLTKSDYYHLTIDDFSIDIILKPGDSIYISKEFINNRNKSFSGKGALLNNYILNDKLYSDEINNSIDFDSIYSMSSLKFINSIDSIYGQRNVRFEKFIASEKISNELFISLERKRVLYEASIEKNLYYRDHKFLTGQKPIIDKEFNSFHEKIDLNDSAILHLESYRNFLYTYFESKALQLKDLSNDNPLFTELAFENVINNISNPKIMSYVLYRIMDVHLNETSVNELGNLIDEFNKSCLNDIYKEKINNYYSRLEKLKLGMPAPNFTFPDNNGQNISLKDFVGKLVYIDVWNSLCSPCFKEFPLLEQLIEKYKGQEIVFIGISYDSNQQLWKKTIEKKNLKGVQLFANGWNSQFGKDYLVYSNPRFILIDKDGNFINAKAPRPSENIEKIINAHIK